MDTNISPYILSGNTVIANKMKIIFFPFAFIFLFIFLVYISHKLDIVASEKTILGLLFTSG